MKLAEIFLPLNDNNGKLFPAYIYERISKELTENFGGVTAFSRAPAKGRWKDDSNDTASKDDIIIFEVMADVIDNVWWKNYQANLKEIFKQDEILIRFSEIEIL